MARITFEDKSFIEIKKASNPDKILVLIQAKDGDNTLKKITNCVELDKTDLETLLADLK